MNENGFVEKLRLHAIEKYAPPADKWTPPDKALYSPINLFDQGFEKVKELRLKAIKYAFNLHYNNSYFYNKFCKTLEVSPDDIKSEDDYKLIPLISDLIFKNHPEQGRDFVNWLGKIYVGDFKKLEDIKNTTPLDNIIDLYQNLGVTLVFSSGTSGSFSFVPRDRTTWNRQMYVCSKVFEMSPYDYFSKKSTIIWLGPNPAKTHLYIGRLTLVLKDVFEKSDIYFGIDRELSTKIIKTLMGTSKDFSGKMKGAALKPFIAREQSKAMDKIINILEKNKNRKERIGFGGAPFLIEYLMSKIEKRGLNYDFPEGMTVTAGGWKAHSGTEIPAERFRNKINKIFGIPQQNCRDIYGMVECNALSVTCEGHYKHIPTSIIYPMVLNDESEPLGFGEYGRFAFIDPLANSYPGFIMTGDRVKLLESCPVCEKSGPVICQDVTRLSGVQDRGCGATLSKMFTEELEKTSDKQ